MMHKAKIFNVSGKKVLCIFQPPEANVPCGGCTFLYCCKGKVVPILTPEEFESHKYSTGLMPLPKWLKKQAPTADLLAGINMDSVKGCPYLSLEGRCCIYNRRPQACKAYDCRNDTRKEISEFCRKHFKVK